MIPITHLIHSSGHTSLKIAEYQEYFTPQAGLSGPMKKSNLINSVMSTSIPSTLSIFFTLEAKGMGNSCAQKEGGKGAGLQLGSISWRLFVNLLHVEFSSCTIKKMFIFLEWCIKLMMFLYMEILTCLDEIT
jgi:hypothetical protein